MSHVLILGGDGYLGWPTAMYFSARDYKVTVVDNYFRRNACKDLNAEMLYPVPNLVAVLRRVPLFGERVRGVRSAHGDARN